MVVTDAGILTVTERCLHTLTPAPQQQLPSPDLAPAPVTTERKPAQDSELLSLHNHYTMHHSTTITRWYHTTPESIAQASNFCLNKQAQIFCIILSGRSTLLILHIFEVVTTASNVVMKGKPGSQEGLVGA